MNKFKWGNLNKPGIYLDETVTRMAMNSRSMFGRLAEALILEGKTDSARKVLDRCQEIIPERVIPHDYFSVSMVGSYLKAGDTATAMKISEQVKKTSTSELNYYFAFPDKYLKSLDLNIQESLFTLQRLGMVLTESGKKEEADAFEPEARKYYDLFLQKVYEPEER